MRLHIYWYLHHLLRFLFFLLLYSLLLVHFYQYRSATTDSIILNTDLACSSAITLSPVFTGICVTSPCFTIYYFFYYSWAYLSASISNSTYRCCKLYWRNFKSLPKSNSSKLYWTYFFFF